LENSEEEVLFFPNPAGHRAKRFSPAKAGLSEFSFNLRPITTLLSFFTSFLKLLSRLTDLKNFPLVLSLILTIPLTLLPIMPSSHFPIVSDAWSATYYVDATNGNDGNNGLSPENP
jgi:hypothetical protein